MVLCAQALESARILLNSASARNPGGLGNSSGALGHYLMDHLWVAGGATGEFPGLERDGRALDGPNRPNGIYVVRFRNTKRTRSKRFLRGYGFQGGDRATTLQTSRRPASARRTSSAVREPPTRRCGLVGFGECLPYFENYVEIDPSGQVDACGHPDPQGPHGLGRQRARR